MLEIYFSASKMLEHLRSGPCGPFLDGFAGSLERQGYVSDTAVRYLRAAAHVGHVMAERDASVSDINLTAFEQHLRSCRCPRAKGGRRNHHTIYGARLFRRYLEEIGVCKPAVVVMRPAEPQLIVGFKIWLSKHRGASDATIRLYARDAIGIIDALGADPTRWCPADIRGYFMTRASTCGRGTIEKMTTSLRAFLRYLSVQGHSPTDLDNAVPAYAHWQLAEMPRYLSGEQVNCLIDACEGDADARKRDRAILLLLARLGLRAGDVAQLRLIDIEWQAGSLRVTGKSRHEVRLPLPQDVGDAVAAYLECRPLFCQSDRVFLSTIAPSRPFLNGDAVSSVVRRIMKRAGLVTPFKGAHVLRHTAATEMLRHGVPLDKIGLVLRHSGIDTTAHYAKADVTLLRQVAQPWPGAL